MEKKLSKKKNEEEKVKTSQKKIQLVTIKKLFYVCVKFVVLEYNRVKKKKKQKSFFHK